MKHIIISSKTDINNVKNEKLIILNTDEKTARAMIDSIKSIEFLKAKKIAVIARDNQFNRRALETLKINYLISPEKAGQKDTLKQRESGLNHVIAKIAKEKNISIIIDVSYLKNLDKKKKAQALSKIIQNINICKKTNTNIKITDLENKTRSEQLKAILFSLKASSQQVKNSILN